MADTATETETPPHVRERILAAAADAATPLGQLPAALRDHHNELGILRHVDGHLTSAHVNHRKNQ